MVGGGGERLGQRVDDLRAEVPEFSAGALLPQSADDPTRGTAGGASKVGGLIRFKADASEPPGGAVGEPRGEGRTGNSDADRGADLPNRTLGRGALPGGVGGHIVEHGTRQLGGGEPQAEPVDREQSGEGERGGIGVEDDRKSTRLNSSHVSISYAVFCLKKKRKGTSREACSGQETQLLP